MTATFAYRAQSIDGLPLSGTVDAENADQARARLEALRLRVIELEPANPPPAGRALRGEDFIAFNQQLAHLSAAGLPLEHGLRLIAQDMRRGRVAETVRRIADDLEAGTPLAQAFERHGARFPPAYARLIEAGVRANDLSGMLLGLGQHLQTTARLRAALWRSLAYPLMVFVALCLVLAFISRYILPQFEVIFLDFGVKLPAITVALLEVGEWMGTAALVAAGAVVVGVVLSKVLTATGRHHALRDAVGLRLPLVGPVVRRSLIARWCGALRMAVSAGMDLPAALRTASDATGSPRLRRDAEVLAAAVESGQPPDPRRRLSVLPATVTASIDLAARHRNLADALGTLADMYQQQAHARIGIIPAVLTPVLLSVLMGVIGFVILALFAPFVGLIQAVSGG